LLIVAFEFLSRFMAVWTQPNGSQKAAAIVGAITVQ